jgi:hypothetical protein
MAGDPHSRSRPETVGIPLHGRTLEPSGPHRLYAHLRSGRAHGWGATLRQGLPRSSLHFRGDQADLKIHGTEQGLKLRELGRADYVVPTREALKQVLFFPFRVLGFFLAAVATIVLVILFLVLVFAPGIFLPGRSGF